MDARNTHRLITTLFCYMIIGRQLCHVQALRQSKPFGAELDDAKALASMHKDVRRRIVRLDQEFVSSCLQSRTDGTVHDYSSFDIEDDEKVNPISLSKYQGECKCSFSAYLECRTIDASVSFRTNSADCDHGKLLWIHASVSIFESVEKLLSVESFSNSRFPVQSVRSGKVPPLQLSTDFELVVLVQQEPGTTGAEILNGIRFVRRTIHLSLSPSMTEEKSHISSSWQQLCPELCDVRTIRCQRCRRTTFVHVSESAFCTSFGQTDSLVRVARRCVRRRSMNFVLGQTSPTCPSARMTCDGISKRYSTSGRISALSSSFVSTIVSDRSSRPTSETICVECHSGGTHFSHRRADGYLERLRPTLLYQCDDLHVHKNDTHK